MLRNLCEIVQLISHLSTFVTTPYPLPLTHLFLTSYANIYKGNARFRVFWPRPDELQTERSEQTELPTGCRNILDFYSVNGPDTLFQSFFFNTSEDDNLWKHHPIIYDFTSGVIM